MLINKPFRPTLLSSSLGILNAGLGRLASAGNVFLDNGYNTGGSYNPASVQLSGAAEYIALASIGIYISRVFLIHPLISLEYPNTFQLTLYTTESTGPLVLSNLAD